MGEGLNTSDTHEGIRLQLGNLIVEEAQKYGVEKKAAKKKEKVAYEPPRQKTLESVVREFVAEDINNATLFTSEEYGVSFPITKINVADFARALYKKYARDLPPPSAKKEQSARKKKSTKEFIFGSFPTTTNGSIFSHFEPALNKLMLKLPAALEATGKGEEPEETDVYIIGSPTNVLGTMSQKFTERIRDKGAFDAFGDIYAECVKVELEKGKEGEKTTNVNFYGFSMGANFAVKTAEKLTERDAVVTQDAAKPLPKLHVQAYTPVGLIEKKRWRIKAGAVASVISGIANRYVGTALIHEDVFNRDVNAALAAREENPIRENMTPQQKKLKKEALRAVIAGIEEGMPVPKTLTVDMIRGIYDEFVYSGAFRRKAAQKKKEDEAKHADETHGKGKNSLGAYRVSGENSNERTTAVTQGHAMAFFRKNALGRLNTVAEILEQLETASA